MNDLLWIHSDLNWIINLPNKLIL